jgi:hypothetical protein
MSEMKTKYMRDASYLLPPPGGEVVRQLLDDYDTLLARHNALREAVEWERESQDLHDSRAAGFLETWEHYIASRAEVDRLLGE